MAAGAAVILRRDQTPAPAKDRVWSDDAGYLTQNSSSEFLAADGESTPLGVGHAQRSRPQVLPQDAIFLPEIVDHVFLTAVHPASDGQHEKLQRRGHRLRVPVGGWDRFRPRRIFRTLRGHLRRLVHEYVAHYHGERNHQGLGNRLLQRAPSPVRSGTDVQRRVRLGGLLSFYHREAA